MCGILGYAGQSPPDAATFQRALDVIAHRGPDGEGTADIAAGPTRAVLGHRRLAIIDLSPGGAQPMTSADGRFTIVFNGEIFNYQEIRGELERQGVVFRSHSDTEVLLEAYTRRGPAIFAGLNGMFGLAIVDRETGELVLARDHLGIKPVYYAMAREGLVFGSEIKAMLPLGVAARLDRVRLGEYLAQMWVQEPHTLFEGIAKLPAGSFARFAGGRLEVERFWDVRPVGLIDARQARQRLEGLLDDAVRLQLIADVPVGSYISGGVDSSLITQSALRTVPELIAVSARLSAADQKYEGIEDDGAWADRFAAEHPRMQYFSEELSAGLYEDYKRLIWHLDEPIADPAIVPAFRLARRARQSGAIVMLSGMGGDELFGGYSRYGAVQALPALEALPDVARRALHALTGAAQRLPSGPAKRLASHADRLVGSVLDEWPQSYVNMSGHLASAEIDALVGRSWRAPLGDKLRSVLAGFEASSALTQAQRLDLKGFLASHNLIYSDKASMAASVEVRVPLLDYRLAELAFAIPDALRATLREQKVLLKQICAERVGEGYAYRPKAGFTMPARSWLRQELRPQVEGAVLRGRLGAVLDRAAAKRILDDHYAERQENTWKLWTLLTLDLWLERFDVAV